MDFNKRYRFIIPSIFIFWPFYWYKCSGCCLVLFLLLQRIPRLTFSISSRWNFVLCLLPVASEQVPLFLISLLRESGAFLIHPNFIYVMNLSFFSFFFMSRLKSPSRLILDFFLCRFSNKNLSFATIDLGLFPNAAEKFGISLGTKPC